MHLSEGILPLDQALVWSAITVPALAWSVRGEALARKEQPSSAVLMAGATSLLFAGTLMPLPVPVVGATSHICLTPLLALIVGVRRILWPTFFVLLLHAMFFAHGGITTLGVNALTLGLVGPLVTVGAWGALQRMGANGAVGFGLACFLGGMSVYVTDALVLAAALSDTAEPATTFGVVLLGFAPVQLPLSILEAVVSVYILRALVTRRASLVPPALHNLRGPKQGGMAALVALVSFGVSGCAYEGIDGTIFGAEAERAGRPPTDSIMDFSQGEFGLAMTIIILFGLGFVAGRSWERLSDEESDALPR
ncbi:MAG: energy-coupling factor ABC transporter permease [Myxococcota bacterium]|nr:energy-coupling factor ABC transporter permease [Myxococcota bacterium]MEC9388963.1 energy-coupling factor ABC transporter permease [Myxococcota bacterium]